MISEEHRQTVSAGELIADRYELVKEIGSGGWGTVFRARDRSLNGEPTVLKILSASLGKDEKFFTRFRNEIVLARRLSHPNIVRIFDFGHAGQGCYYITMEFVDGCDLRKLMERQRDQDIGFIESLEVLFQITLALGYAHRLGIVHRDVKPDNVLIYGAGQVKLGDFGSARQLKVEPSISPSGELVGTPHYMAPEMLRGETPDPRVDIYAFGILAFELLAGENPFESDNILGLIAKQLNHPLPLLSEFRDDIPEWFQDLVETCTEKNPADRFQSIAEVSAVLFEQLRKLDRAPCINSLPEDLTWRLTQIKKRRPFRLFGLVGR